MVGNSEHNVVINDLLSFLSCKLKFTHKYKLINSINNFYSKVDVTESLKTLLASLPNTLRAKYTERTKHWDPLSLIYDCIQVTNKEDLPIFVCKDLNNIPCLETSWTADIKENYAFHKKGLNNLRDGEKEMDDDQCRKEQKKMKTQILEMMSIITELKDGLQKLNKNQNPSVKVKEKEKKEKTYNSYYKEKRKQDLKLSYEKKSQVEGLALIQRLIDEDCENSKPNSVAEEDCSSNSSDSEVDFSSTGDYYEINELPEERLKKHWNSLKAKKQFRPNLSPRPTLIFAHTGTVDEKVISINVDDTLLLKTDQNPSFKADEDTIEISETFLPHIEEVSVSPRISSDILSQNELEGDFSTVQEKYDFRTCPPEKCPVCNVTFVSKYDYDQHAKAHYTKSTYDCALCNEGFTLRDTLVQHFVLCFRELKHHCNLDKYTCPTCGSFYADQTSLVKHKSFHSECRPFPCSFCSYRYFSSNSLKLHIRNQHNPMNKYQCPLCDLSFLCNSFLLTHIAIHTGSRPFSCKVCDHKADTKKAIKTHIHKHGENHPKKFECKECSYTCNGKYILLKHCLIKHREPVQCPLCEKTFKNPSAYKRHYDIHQSKNSLKCRVCLYSTPFKRYLDKHMLTHPTSTKFECPKCAVPLSSKHTVGHHLRSYCKNSLKNSVH